MIPGLFARRSRWSLLALLATVSGVLACLDPLDPEALAGTWVMFEHWAGDSVACSIVLESLTVVVRGNRLVGQLDGGAGLCINYGIGLPTRARGSISLGTVREGAIRFNMTPDFLYEGQQKADQLSGTVPGRVLLGPPSNKVVPVTGTWEATRQ